jgi:8-oxo-dGTP diphosphatase
MEYRNRIPMGDAYGVAAFFRGAFPVYDHRFRVLPMQRGIPPFKDQYALPGEFVLPGETLDAAAFRELCEGTGTADV